MEKIIDLLTAEASNAFAVAGYGKEYGKVVLSNRPDLCEYQCNGAMAAAKEYKIAPFLIADKVAQALEGSALFSMAESVKPGFLNLKLNPDFLAGYLERMMADLERPASLSETKTREKEKPPKRILIDYGGANVAKPLHVGHLRSAIIGESLKRIGRFLGHEVIGDIHMGDWGLQMGLIIVECRMRHPEWVYFDEGYQGDYPQEAPFTIEDLEEIYPTASAKSKKDAEFKEQAMKATYELQQGKRGYQALLDHIMKISVVDLKRVYDELDVSFDLWKGESDAMPFIPDMVEKMKALGYAYESDGALVVDVKEEGDTREIPPCMILKSDGASLYTTTDLATLVWRMKDYDLDEVIYLTDKRQEMHFIQVFRCAKKTGIVKPETELKFLGFGTMNGKGGKPFKTRDGGVMRLQALLSEINEEMYRKIAENHRVEDAEGRETAEIVALSALKYGDLSNQAVKDYVFDIDRFTSFEGNTGPYILYTIVRIKSILKKYYADKPMPVALTPAKTLDAKIPEPKDEGEKELMLALSRFNGVMEVAFDELAPHKVCAYLYDLANAFNQFYHQTKILTHGDAMVQAGYIKLLELTKRVLEVCIDVLGFSAPDKM